MQGRLEVIVGGMYSGKTEELIRRLNRARIARLCLQVFKPVIDNRYHAENVTSHNMNSRKATPVASSEEIWTLLESETQVVGIDEAQFFDAGIVEVCQRLADSGVRVIVAGLDTDWKAKPFGPMPYLLAVADEVAKQHAVCVVCGQAASRTQKLAPMKKSENGQEAGSENSQILVGSHGLYEARCRQHFQAKAMPPTTAQPATWQPAAPAGPEENPSALHP